MAVFPEDCRGLTRRIKTPSYVATLNKETPQTVKRMLDRDRYIAELERFVDGKHRDEARDAATVDIVSPPRTPALTVKPS